MCTSVAAGIAPGSATRTIMVLVDRALNLVLGIFFAVVGWALAMNIRGSAEWLAAERFSVFFRPSQDRRAPFIRGLGWVWLVGGLLVMLAQIAFWVAGR